MIIALLAVLMAAGLEAARASRRVRAYRQYAVAHAAFRDLGLAEAEEYRFALVHGEWADDKARTELLQREAGERALTRHCDSLAAKYRDAARFPWLPVEPDPPQPH